MTENKTNWVLISICITPALIFGLVAFTSVNVGIQEQNRLQGELSVCRIMLDVSMEREKQCYEFIGNGSIGCGERVLTTCYGR